MVVICRHDTVVVGGCRRQPVSSVGIGVADPAVVALAAVVR